jgi:hypothetical protein
VHACPGSTSREAVVFRNQGRLPKLYFSLRHLGFSETGETPGDLFDRGFLPSSRDLDRFYACRHVRIDLSKFQASSENRRVLRKGEGIVSELIPRCDFEFTDQRREFYKTYADIKFGKDVMSYERLDWLFKGKITSHILIFKDTQKGAEVGTVTLYVEPPHMAYYYYAFYDLNYYGRNLGMHMMTAAVGLFAQRRFKFLYLGSCYSANALYKTQFAGRNFLTDFVGPQGSMNSNISLTAT